MAPRKNTTHSNDHDALILLEQAVEALTEQVKQNAAMLDIVREQQIVMKTRIGLVAACFGAIASAGITIGVRLLTH